MASFSDKPTIDGERVTLRPLVSDDADDMWADLADEEALRLTGTHDTFTRDQINAWCASRADQNDRLDLAVVERTTGAWAGEVVISDWDPDNACCNFRIALRSTAQDRGLGSEATRLIVDYAFVELGVHRIELEVFAFNPRAIAVYEKLGFVHEGVRRHALLWDGEWIDALVMSIVATDRA